MPPGTLARVDRLHRITRLEGGELTADVFEHHALSDLVLADRVIDEVGQSERGKLEAIQQGERRGGFSVPFRSDGVAPKYGACSTSPTPFGKPLPPSSSSLPSGRTPLTAVLDPADRNERAQPLFIEHWSFR
ncbi:MAG: hypothetical protein HYV07_23320 [Deltaproteobacteria bacterium]|nr:hypothetical protein [Deltaproteobacteria bacterium]